MYWILKISHWYPLVNCYITMKDPPFAMEKSTISTGPFSIAIYLFFWENAAHPTKIKVFCKGLTTSHWELQTELLWDSHPKKVMKAPSSGYETWWNHLSFLKTWVSWMVPMIHGKMLILSCGNSHTKNTKHWQKTCVLLLVSIMSKQHFIKYLPTSW